MKLDMSRASTRTLFCTGLRGSCSWQDLDSGEWQPEQTMNMSGRRILVEIDGGSSEDGMSRKSGSCLFPLTMSTDGPEQTKLLISRSGALFGHAVSAGSRICKILTSLRLRYSQLLSGDATVNDFCMCPPLPLFQDSHMLRYEVFQRAITWHPKRSDVSTKYEEVHLLAGATVTGAWTGTSLMRSMSVRLSLTMASTLIFLPLLFQSMASICL